MSEVRVGFRDGVNRVARIDDADAELVAGFRWRFYPEPAGETGGYAVANVGGKRIYMHRLIVGLRDRSLVVDHINRDGLDNRRENLRVLTAAQNAQNATTRRDSSTGHRGVQRVYRRGRVWYRVQVGSPPHRVTRIVRDLDTAISVAHELRRRHMPFSTT